MKATDVHQSTILHRTSGLKSYSAPGLKRLAPEAAREILLRRADANDPEIKFMLDCIERLKEPKGS